MNATENIDQSTNSFLLDWRELHNIDVHSLSTFVAAKLCLSRLCFPLTLAKWITRMPNKGKKEKVMFHTTCVSFIALVHSTWLWAQFGNYDRSVVRPYTLSLYFSCQMYQASKSGGNAKQANKENGDAVSDEVRWKFRVWLEKSFRCLCESHQDHDIVYWDGCWLIDFSVRFFSCVGKAKISACFSSSKSSSEAQAICKWTVNYEEGEAAKFFVFQCERQSRDSEIASFER